MARVWSLVLALAAALPLFVTNAGGQNSTTLLNWPPVTSQTRPWTRWWWPGSAVNKVDLTVEMEKYRKAALGGLEITPIYGARGAEDRFINFLSPAWVEMLEHTLKEAERLGMGIDMATGTGWPFGGPWVGAEDACKEFVYQSYTLKAGERLDARIIYMQKPLARAVGRRIDISELKNPVSANQNLQELALDQVRFETRLPLVTLMAYSGPLDRGKTLDLTDKVGPDGKLDWIAPDSPDPKDGAWTLYAIFQGWRGRLVKRAAPGGEGDVIDHFSATALKHYLSRFDQAFAGRDIRGLRAFFNDSYEVDEGIGESNWTPNFLTEFERRRGYDLRGTLPALLGKDSPEKNARVLCDFRETISDLLRDEFTTTWREWAAGKGKIVRDQAHGSPANILDLYAASDIPETEGQEIPRMKFATSAAHVTGKPLASSETATWLNEHTLPTLGEVKQAVDKFFLGGVNHIVYHGTPFSPESEPWPGWMFYAEVHFGPTNPFWNDFEALNRYVARCQSFLQAGKPDNDLLLYYPIYDSWEQTPVSARGMLPHYGGGIESELGQVDGQNLQDGGYSYDLISDRQLRSVEFAGGGLQTGGVAYRAVILPETRFIPSETFERLVTLAREGATIIVRGALPSDVPGWGGLERRRASLRESISGLRFDKTDGAAQVAKIGKGMFLLGADLKKMLVIAGIKPEPMAAQGLRFIRRKDGNRPYYFIVNQGDRAVDGWIALRGPAQSVAIFDPMREEKGIAATRRSGAGGTEVYLQLDPGQSCVLKTFDAPVKGATFAYFKTAGEPQPLNGKWSLRFVSGGPELPAAIETDKLGSWTDLEGEAVKRFSGTAVYSISFTGHRRGDWALDLGRIAESARVKLNGKEIGALISSPYRIQIPEELLKEENTLEIAVSNLMTNRIIDLDRRGVKWKKFYNINMPAHRRENAGPDGLFTTAGWTPRESGLIGPVALIPVERFSPQ
ncbi:MAG: glycoside hydrolase family 2 protein [Chloracidobacterium sp.]|nr:glycoside hydrolase family 2 protein [Chloracidobacterium sp.]